MKTDGYSNGQFCWVDLQTTDLAAAKQFYAALLGWDAQDVPTDKGPLYTMFSCNGLSVAGMGPMPPDMQQAGAPPVWSSYICVDDAEATVGTAQQLGATVLMPTMKVMEQGWLAFLQDPTGAAFGLWQPNEHKGAGWVNSTGGFCWNELYTNDIDRSRSFYEQLFGWEFSKSAMGSGDYWSLKNDGRENGGMMEIKAEWGEMRPSWAVYFTVDSCSQAQDKALSLGAKQFMPPTQIPEVGTFCGLQDPQGAHFLLIDMTDLPADKRAG